MTPRTLPTAFAAALLGFYLFAGSTAGVDAQTAATTLGTVTIPRNVMANGQPLPAGTYQVRLTGEEPPTATGATSTYERWVEFVQRGQVKGREIASVIPQAEAKTVVTSTPPARGASKVQMLRGNEFLRVWFNRGGDHYLIHLVPAMSTTR